MGRGFRRFLIGPSVIAATTVVIVALPLLGPGGKMFPEAVLRGEIGLDGASLPELPIDPAIGAETANVGSVR